MRIVDLIEIKKNNKELSKEQIEFMIKGFTSGDIKDYQMSSMAMAIRLNGMTPKETAHLTMAMMYSGDVIDLSGIEGVKVDKHSTGGIGDKASLAIGPIVASLGAKMAKMSGKGLGFTGGTLDKLESIKGFNIELETKDFIKQVNDIGLAIISQTGNIVPADKKLYALRDVTGTVDSLPLIVSSIMSKKLATGSDSILLDVKMGDGAFMKTLESARELGKMMISIGKELDKDVRVEITNMSKPLGRAIGNKNEVIEAMDTLKGKGPEDFTELVISSSIQILLQAKIFDNKSDAKKAIEESLTNGSAFDKFIEWVKYQGADVESLLDNNFWSPKYKHEVLAKESGIMNITSAVSFGIAAMKIGAGREEKEDLIDYEAGIQINKKTNESVSKGDVLFTLYSSNEINEEIVKSLESAYNIVENKIDNKIIIERIE